MTQISLSSSATMQASMDSHDLFFHPESKHNTKETHIWNIKATKQMLGPDICSHIFFIHALLGCDTTSRLYVIGKGASLKRFRASHTFCEQAKVFDTHSASIHDVVEALWTPSGISGSARRWLQVISQALPPVPQPACIPESTGMERICR